jgi:hypothetical protein
MHSATSRSHLALHDELISKAFHGRSGRAYLFSKVINVTLGRQEDRLLSTGLHSVSDIFCINCGESVGWFYEFAHQLSQKYKEGKYILEKQKIFQDYVAPDGASPTLSPVANSADSDSADERMHVTDQRAEFV